MIIILGFNLFILQLKWLNAQLNKLWPYIDEVSFLLSLYRSDY